MFLKMLLVCLYLYYLAYKYESYNIRYYFLGLMGKEKIKRRLRKHLEVKSEEEESDSQPVKTKKKGKAVKKGSRPKVVK